MEMFCYMKWPVRHH
ncbi:MULTISPECIES: hypothetical protein [Citrobacter]|nr:MULTISPECIES: hypothetical protein [Citrobacter]HAT6800969.1 hypothetical protein [Citrobacter freundii]EKU0078871.1 hypothetical protein [Citrobacter farmeri]EKW2928796.1 hypothetical protein [Citrobacter amalonaticus]ELK6621718.1 hypothetical protein [Citrobacter amalonaticus]MBJ9137511.1 hypothetical protein [Citrobacter farmeri]